MTPFYDKDGITIYCGDSLKVMPLLDANSIDTVCTDPPYGLNFMGSNWDHGIPGIPFWQAALTVAKPGAMLLSFGGTRTYHRLTCAIEDAGWEIRDSLRYFHDGSEQEAAFYNSLNPDQRQAYLELLHPTNEAAWVYGQGFPKSRDISKAIDKTKGMEREVVGQYVRPDGTTRATEGGRTSGPFVTYMNEGDAMTTAPATPEAAAFDGYGTALKPSVEPIVLAMAPIEQNFAYNALKWGVAGLWIDGGRIGTDKQDDYGRSSCRANGTRNRGEFFNGLQEDNGNYSSPQGRWPANTILSDDPEVLARFPVTSSGKPMNRFHIDPGRTVEAGPTKDGIYYHSGYGDTGSAARFFYQAKASKRERGDGNNHPCVKPLALVRYLLRLTRTPTGGIVLDPFMGSGTTLLAARAEGRRAIGIEANEDYCKIAVSRLGSGKTYSLPSEPKAHKNGKVTAKQLELI